MQVFLYLSLIPEALIASHLPPEEFGAYLSIGTKKRSRGQAIFFKIADDYAQERLANFPDIDKLQQNKIQRSAYLSIYRVLEHLPLEALESLHLATDDGMVLQLTPGDYQAPPDRRFHLYQEFCPVTPRVVSDLPPREFGALMTDPCKPVSLPALVFAELKLESLADDPEATAVDNLPYHNLEHLRDCLRELAARPEKHVKPVVRHLEQDVMFRTLRGGFYVANHAGGLRFFPMHEREALETTYYPWWRSALRAFGA